MHSVSPCLQMEMRRTVEFAGRFVSELIRVNIVRRPLSFLIQLGFMLYVPRITAHHLPLHFASGILASDIDPVHSETSGPTICYYSTFTASLLDHIDAGPNHFWVLASFQIRILFCQVR
uniref:Uncharacterized protein n=1 Tax=Schistocephalus solidus TaxID=70667 RepID=A0A0X3P6B2_SCHSO